MHVHLNHEECFEVVLVRGITAEAQRLADRLSAEKGVRHGNVMLVPVEIDNGARGHVQKGTAGSAHQHIKPIS